MPLSTDNVLVESGLTATTVSASTYQGLPLDIRVTGGTYSNGTATFTNNTGGTFDIIGFNTSVSTLVTGFTYSNNLFRISNSTGGTLSVLANTMTGLTVNGNISATTITASTSVSATSISATTLIITTTGSTKGFGYGVGAGASVTQLTSKATTVIINALCGTITMFNAALSSGTTVAFTVTNSSVNATDIIHVQHDSVGTLGAYAVMANTPAAGSFKINVSHLYGAALSEAIVLRFAVIRSSIT
jgi:hypothetical protein